MKRNTQELYEEKMQYSANLFIYFLLHFPFPS